MKNMLPGLVTGSRSQASKPEPSCDLECDSATQFCPQPAAAPVGRHIPAFPHYHIVGPEPEARAKGKCTTGNEVRTPLTGSFVGSSQCLGWGDRVVVLRSLKGIDPIVSLPGTALQGHMTQYTHTPPLQGVVPLSSTQEKPRFQWGSHCPVREKASP